MSAFDKLAPYIQEYIWNHQWNELRDVQVEAISSVMDTEDHVLISAGTAAGKTEAAFFPMLSMVDIPGADSFSIMYIGPLKALINDQFERINDLLDAQDYPIYAWHGDRAQSEKKHALRNPKGVLQITPESLEALLLRHAGEVPRMFRQLQFIVIDELHAFMGTDRGMQLQCQLTRLDRLLGRPIRRVGLSATLNSLDDAAAYLGAGSPLGVSIVNSREGKRQLRLSLRHDTLPDDLSDEYSLAVRDQMEYLYRQVQGRKCIIFTPSRRKSEEIAIALHDCAESHQDPDFIFVHHGSVSAALRAEAEASLRSNDQPAVAIATKTLELGIDLGQLDKVVQIGSASSCSSFVQRLGRTGRRGTPAVMQFITSHIPSHPDAFDDLPIELLTNIAVIQLYLQEHWVEPAFDKPLPYSLLAHQTLAWLMSVGEATPQELLRAVWTLPPFAQVPKADYASLLRNMIGSQYLERMEDGKLIPGLKGERMANHYSFYSVFADQASCKVIHEQHEIGELDQLPKENTLIQLAGRSWEVYLVDQDRRIAYVKPAATRAKASWIGSQAGLDDRVVQRIRQILVSDEQYPYLLPGAVDALQQCRAAVADCQLDSWYTIVGEHELLLHPWWGTRKLETLMILLAYLAAEPLKLTMVSPSLSRLGFSVITELDAEELPARMKEFIPMITMDKLIPLMKPTELDRYDICVPEDLLRKAYSYHQLDLPGVQEALAQLPLQTSQKSSANNS